ncbi:anthrone oxygenase family protein [Modestobacter sp. Leaf380]|uniref:anthrone oxygenase family protein n=1 Tax=Modestobacter sp. Leaf380 TaxID=1736356 RepID=UPI0006FA9A55|nr:anthrone oxygenase family protein [Modestobacter sp. Leaf380]KQS71222.1 hypothetical protein ASG41_20770 [Modestobacter sp. Leaf380]
MNAATALTVAATVGTGLVGGVFASFSGLVMPALDRLAPQQAAAAMQAVNEAALRPPLLGALFGTAAVCLATAVVAARAGGPAAPLVLLGAGVYLVGTVGVTIAANVPLNDALAATASDSTTAEGWAAWSDSWTTRNTVRTVAALAATGLYAASLRA